MWVVLSALMLINFMACDKNDEETEDFYLVDLEDEVDDWDLFAFSKDGSSLLIKEDVYGSQPEVVFFTPEKNAEGYPIFLDDNGFPEMVVIENYIFVFRQVDNLHVDIAMVTPEGEVVLTRDIETGVDWAQELKTLNADESWGGVARWAGRVASIAGCALSIKAALATGGAAIPLAKWGCGAMVVSFAAQAVDAEVVGLSSDAVGLGISLVGCPGDPLGCVIGIGSFASGFVADALDHTEQNQQVVNAANGALMGGHGDVQVTLTWNNINDIDLHVIDPDGYEIYYADPHSTSGGELDYDNTYGYGPENIFWQQNAAPEGTFQVYVNHYDGSQAANYTVVINAFGFVKTFTGTVQLDQKVHVANFSQNGIGAKSQQEAVYNYTQITK